MGRYQRALLALSVVFHCPHATISFTSRIQQNHRLSKVAPLHGTMLRSAMQERAAARQKKRLTSGAVTKDDSRSTPIISLEFLEGAAREAMFRQRRILEALREQNDKQGQQQQAAIGSVNKRREEIQQSMTKIQSIQVEMKELKQSLTSVTDLNALQTIKDKLIELGFQSVISQGPNSWRHVREICRNSKAEFGRPADFTGLVYKSPHGVPILVGRKGAHNDGVLRRISQGSDLWFQCEDYSGSRVLLRTSLARGLKNSKSCRQAAADLAAYYSDYRKFESVPIMYTDSKRVAKRGSKKGQMRKRKSLGTMYGYPRNVDGICQGKEP